MRPMLLLALVACVDNAPPEFCSGTTVQHYTPLSADELLMWPDDGLTVADATSPTGLRIDLTPDRAPWFHALPPLVHDLLRGLDIPSGFARQGAIVMRFSEALGELPSDMSTSLTDEGLQLWELADSGAVRRPFEVVLDDQGRQLRVQPLKPLAPGRRHALVLTTAHIAADGACVAPSATTRGLLTGNADPLFEPMVDRYAELLEATGLEADQISAASLFTTHADHTVLADAADDIRDRDYSWTQPLTCDAEVCSGSFDAWDYREEGVIRTGQPQDTWTLDVSVWLPRSTVPVPVLVFGHGMNGKREQAQRAWDTYGYLGFAVVSIDAVQHGGHPTRTGPEDQAGVRFLGVDLTALEMDGRTLRGNFEQSFLDRAQLAELLHDSPDLDGDGVADIDPDRMVYLGESLGGMLGAGTMSLTDHFDAAVLFVAGGYLTRFVTDSTTGSIFASLATGQLGSEAALQRMLPVLQTVVDPADPAMLGAHLLRDRLGDPSHRPSVLLPVATFDDVVPPSAGSALAQAAELPHVGEPVWDVPGLPLSPEGATGNLGESTAAYFQYDRVQDGRPADHGNTPGSPEAVLQARHFLETWLDGGPPVVVDPYVELETPPLRE